MLLDSRRELLELYMSLEKLHQVSYSTVAVVSPNVSIMFAGGSGYLAIRAGSFGCVKST